VHAVVTGGTIAVGELTYTAPALVQYEGQELRVAGSLYARVAIPPEGDAIALQLDLDSLRAFTDVHRAQWNADLAKRQRPRTRQRQEVPR
jgi:hypothetical protein